VLDLDIKGFFDNIDHDLLMRAVRRHTSNRWLLLYIERWLKADVCMPDGSVQHRDSGTPQGGVISPLLANLFLHDAFDSWMCRTHPETSFERYADDAICHCDSREQAESLKESLQARLQQCGLQLHPVKTRIAYCADANRRGKFDTVRFDFLGYTFKPRQAVIRRGQSFTSFSPAVADKAGKIMRQKIRRMGIDRLSRYSLDELSVRLNTLVDRWVRYYGLFHRSALQRALRTLDLHIVNWAMRKLKRLRGHKTRAWDWLAQLRMRSPRLFLHWSCDLQRVDR
jgi:group II intron reverse transcriptase/maturase